MRNADRQGLCGCSGGDTLIVGREGDDTTAGIEIGFEGQAVQGRVELGFATRECDDPVGGNRASDIEIGQRSCEVESASSGTERQTKGFAVDVTHYKAADAGHRASSHCECLWHIQSGGGCSSCTIDDNGSPVDGQGIAIGHHSRDTDTASSGLDAQGIKRLVDHPGYAGQRQASIVFFDDPQSIGHDRDGKDTTGRAQAQREDVVVKISDPEACDVRVLTSQEVGGQRGGYFDHGHMVQCHGDICSAFGVETDFDTLKSQISGCLCRGHCHGQSSQLGLNGGQVARQCQRGGS